MHRWIQHLPCQVAMNSNNWAEVRWDIYRTLPFMDGVRRDIYPILPFMDGVKWDIYPILPRLSWGEMGYVFHLAHSELG